MSNEENYIIENEITDITKKQEYWNTGIGLNKVDNLEPSKYLLDLSQKNINGELKYYEVENLLKSYYETQNSNDINIQKEKECDLVSLRIAQLLEDKSFGFSPITLKNIHKYLFKDIYDFAGNYRIYNITKKEDILNGDTIKYVNYQDIESYFDYDFKGEKNFDYSKLNNDELNILQNLLQAFGKYIHLEKAILELRQFLLKNILTIWDLTLIITYSKNIVYILEMLW